MAKGKKSQNKNIGLEFIGGKFTENSGLDEFIRDIEAQIMEDIMLAVHDTYADIRTQLEPHLESDERRPKGRQPGMLAKAIDESERSMSTPDVDISDEGDNIISIGIGNLNILENEAPHWKYIEYGTLEAGQGEWPASPPYKPEDSPKLAKTYVDITNRKGVKPNRAWRMGYWHLIARISVNLGKTLTPNRRRK